MWNKNLQDKVVNYAGIWNKDKANGKLFFHIDTAWVNRGAGNIKPQYLISAAHVDVPGTPGVPCTYAHNHYDNAGNKVDAAHCSHATPAHAGYHYGKYLVNFSDSAKVYDERKVANPYKLSTNSSVNSSYTRVGFVEAIHMGDSLYVLTNGFEKMAPADLDTAEIIANYKKAKIEHFIVNLTGDKHKNVTWSFRYVNPDKAGNVTEEGADNSFLFESNVYGSAEVNGQPVYDDQYTTVYGNKDEAIAPKEIAAWKEDVVAKWDSIEIVSCDKVEELKNGDIESGKEYTITYVIDEKGLNDAVGLELVTTYTTADGKQHVYSVEPFSVVKKEGDLYTFQVKHSLSNAGSFKVSYRMFPKNPELPHRQDFCYVRWFI